LGSDPHSEDYQRQLAAESRKWGDHLLVEATGSWNAWLDHPQIRQHYLDRSLIDGQRWEQFVITHLNGPAEVSLDLGCGSGGRSLAVYEAGATRRIEGTDISEDRVAEGERLRQSSGITGRLWVSDVNTVELPENTYDLIFSCHSFHHFLELEHIMEQVNRALTPRGLFVLEEFIGPTQFQWTDRQLALVRELLALLPDHLRSFRWGARKDMEGRPSVAEVVAASPFESIRSADILPLFLRHFAVTETRALGGTLQHLLYNGIVHNFAPADPEAASAISAVYSVEDALIDNWLLPSDFMLLIGHKRAKQGHRPVS
jgi:SAM-dependent methyltransferase